MRRPHRARAESPRVADDDPLRDGDRRSGLRDSLDGFHQSRLGRQRPRADRQRGEPCGEARRKTNPLQKYIEVSGVRFVQDAKKKTMAKFVIVNHSEADINGLAGNVTIWGRTQKSEEDAQGTFTFNTSLAPYESKELSVPLNTKRKMYELADWQNLTTDVQITAPAGGALGRPSRAVLLTESFGGSFARFSLASVSDGKVLSARSKSARAASVCPSASSATPRLFILRAIHRSQCQGASELFQRAIRLAFAEQDLPVSAAIAGSLGASKRALASTSRPLAAGSARASCSLGRSFFGARSTASRQSDSSVIQTMVRCTLSPASTSAIRGERRGRLHPRQHQGRGRGEGKHRKVHAAVGRKIGGREDGRARNQQNQPGDPPCGAGPIAPQQPDVTPISSAHAAIATQTPDRHVRVHREAIGYDQKLQVAADHGALRQEIFPRRNAGLHAGDSAGDHRRRPDDARPGSHGERKHSGQRRLRLPRSGRSPRQLEPDKQQRKCRAFLLGEQRRGEPGDRDPGTPFEPLPERARNRRGSPARCCAPKRNRPLRIGSGAARRVTARDQRRALRQQAAQAFPGQQHGAQMKQQIEEVIAQRVARADLPVHPESEIGERTRLERRPDLDPAARRFQGGVGENGIIVKVKARTERSAKGDQRGGEQKKTRSHDLNYELT